MISTVTIVGLMVSGLCGLASLALILWFLWRVYDRGGPVHLTSVADALHQVLGDGEPGNQTTTSSSPQARALCEDPIVSTPCHHHQVPFSSPPEIATLPSMTLFSGSAIGSRSR
jgi:hypothetical protein